MSRLQPLLAFTLALASLPLLLAEPPAAPRWSTARLTAVLGDAERHSIHTYFNTSPESPDGKHVLLFTSTTPEAHEGEIWTVERATGKTTVLARNVVTEDAHRAACQQWVAGGKQVVFHDLRDGQWVVVAVTLADGKERVLATGRQLGFGQPAGTLVPVYGPHWAPGQHRDLELLDLLTGELRTIVTAAAVRQAYPDWIGRRFGERPISLFFPLLSPDRNTVIFKCATPAGGDFRSTKASERDGLLCADVRTGKLLWLHERWGHPAWAADSRSLINYSSKGLYRTDAETGANTEHPKLPKFPGSHPSLAPDGDRFTTDFTTGEKGLWGVTVGSWRLGEHEVVHRFDNAGGSTSWRRSHPHPSFSPDGQRLYFNVSAGRWTRLYVAEAGAK